MTIEEQIEKIIAALLANATAGKTDIDACCKQIKGTEAKIKEIEDAHAAELAPYKKLKETLRGIGLQWLQTNKLQNTKTKSGYTPYQIRKVLYRVEDQAQFRHHVVGTQAWGLVYWGKTMADGVRAEALKEVQALGFHTVEEWQTANRLNPNDDPPLPPTPPGVHADQEISLGLKSPPKPKTEGDKTPIKTTSDDNPQVEAL